MNFNPIKYPPIKGEVSNRYIYEFCPHPLKKQKCCFKTVDPNDKIRTDSCKYYFVYPYEYCSYLEKK